MGYSFLPNSNSLTINKGSLIYNPFFVYEFRVETNYLNTIYSQTINVNIDFSPTVPIANLKYNIMMNFAI